MRSFERRTCVLAAVLIVAASTRAQTEHPIATAPYNTAQAQDATITFQLSWPAVQPGEYSIVIHRDGRAEYTSRDKALSPPQERNAPVESNAEQAVQTQDAASQSAFHKEFTASDALRQKIFPLAQQANFFEGQFEFTKHPVAQTGRKTLSYSDATRHASTTYNYSEDPSIQQLTDIFQGISTTIEGGQRLEFDRRFEKLSLDEDLKNLEELCNDGHLQEVQVIAPILQRLAADRTVLHIAQQRAERILKKSGQPLVPTSSD
jgi:hypothetical protein